EYVHVGIDDRTRLAYAEIYPDETAASATAFLGRAVRWFARWGVQVRAVMTDNESGFRGYRFAAGRRQLRLRHLRTRPYSPQTNGKAERFIRTALTEWAYVQPYRTSLARASALTDFSAVLQPGAAAQRARVSDASSAPNGAAVNHVFVNYT